MRTNDFNGVTISDFAKNCYFIKIINEILIFFNDLNYDGN